MKEQFIGGNNKIEFFDTSESVGRINIPRKSPIEEIGAAWDMNLGILLRNMQGLADHNIELGDTIRRLAERADVNGEKFEVAEIRNGVSFGALFFQEDYIRSMGDFMIYGSNKSHKSPDVCSTVVGDRDWVKSVLGEERAARMGDFLESMVIEKLNSTMGYPARFRSNQREDRDAIMERYEKKKRDGDINAVVDADPINAMRSFYKSGKRFDLILPDMCANADRFNYLQGLIACLKPDGAAFVTLEWWSPKSLEEGSGTEKKVFIDDVVQTDSGKVGLGEFLAENYPDNFKIAFYPGAKTLIIMGTKEPLQLPQFEAQQIRGKADNGITIKWIKK